MIPSWRPSADLAILKQRAAVLQRIRAFFNERSYWEVETPAMSRYGITDVYLDAVHATFRGKNYSLHTSPEYAMKRLLAAGSGSIFQLARVFRDDEWGRWHNPEFTLLEWYKSGADHHALIEEMDVFLQEMAGFPALVKYTYQSVFINACALDPFTASLDSLRQCLKSHELDTVLAPDETDRDQYLFLLMSHVVEPLLALEKRPVVVMDFPPSQAALSVIQNGVAQRFEVYYRGIELANGFHELTHAAAQRARFEVDQRARQALGLSVPVIDEYFLQALEHGLPACSGVALGIDRLLMLMFEKESIAEIMAFDFSRM